MIKQLFFMCLMLVVIIFTSPNAAMAEDNKDVPAPEGSINSESEETIDANSWITIQYIGSAPGMDEYRQEDFGWTHTFDPACKDIFDITLTIRAYDVDYDQGERVGVYGDGVFLGYLFGTAGEDWTDTIFDIPASLLSDGELDVWIDIDATNGGWLTLIDYSSLRTHWDWRAPVADFSAVPVAGDAPLCVQFTNLSTCASTFLWDFGDGATSTLENPLHCYDSDTDAKFTVTLTAWGPGGEDTLAKPEFIWVQKYSVCLSSSAGGHVSELGEGCFWVDYDSSFLLTAEIDDPLFRFSHFEGNLYAIDTPYILTVDHDYTIRAIFESLLDVIYVDDNGPDDPLPFDLSLSDPGENGTPDHPFDSVQEAIEVAKEGGTIVIRSGTYTENVDLLGKSLTLSGVDANDWDFPVIQGTGDGPVLTVRGHDNPDVLLQGLVLTGGHGRQVGGLDCDASQLTLANCLIVGNRAHGIHGVAGALRASDSVVNLVNCTISDNEGGSDGAALVANSNSTVTVLDSILWNDAPVEIVSDATSSVVVQYSDVAGGAAGVGNLNLDPQFMMPGDYHLAATSPCLDAGDPNAPYDLEPVPNGDRVNLGAYGNTPQATVTPAP